MIISDIKIILITSLLLTYFALPYIIKIIKKNRFFDKSGKWKIHTVETPALGGIGFLIGVSSGVILWAPSNHFDHLQCILVAFAIVLLIGAWNDIISLSVSRKPVGELLAATILLFLADLGVVTVFGIFGICEISCIWNIVLTLFTIIVIMKFFDLKGGINGWSGVISLFVSVAISSWFIRENMVELASKFETIRTLSFIVFMAVLGVLLTFVPMITINRKAFCKL